MKKMRIATLICAFICAFCAFFVACGDAAVSYSASLDESELAMKVGDEVELSFSTEGFDVRSEGVSWTSSAPAIAAVEAGTVRALAVGSAEITASATAPDGTTVSASCDVQVTAVEPGSTEATYTVQYYGQKKDRSGYELLTAHTQTATATVGSTVTAEAKEITGYVFDGDNVDNVLSAAVAADDGTVLKRYYNIKTIDITFKAEGSADIVKTVDYGDDLTDIPAVPEKTGYSGVWDVTTFTDITAPVTVNAVYTETTIAYALKIAPEKIAVRGAEFDFYDFKPADYAAMTATVAETGGEPQAAEITGGAVTAELKAGEYTFKVVYNGEEYSKTVRVGANGGDTLYIPTSVAVGGKMGEFNSFGSGFETSGKDSIKMTGGYSYAFIDIAAEDITDKYYFEADVNFETVGVFTGFLAACNYKAVDGAGNNKLSFSYSGGNKIYHSLTDAWGPFDVNGYVASLKADPAHHKSAILRDGNTFYLILDDLLVGTYTTDIFGDCGFGFINHCEKGGIATYSNIEYTIKSDVVDALKARFTSMPNLGGSFVDGAGKVVDSFGGNWSANADGASGAQTGPTYIFNGGVAGNIYYAEAEFDLTPKGWAGILINALNEIPSNNNGWYGYGIYYPYGIFMHTTTKDWVSGDPKSGGDVSGTSYKLGVARIYDRYYVFVNDKLVVSEQVPGRLSDGTAVPADNISGFGVFCGGNEDPVNKGFRNFRYGVGIDAVAEYIGGASITYDESTMTVKQNGVAVASGGLIIAGTPVTVEPKTPAGKTVEAIAVMNGAQNVELDIVTGVATFAPAVGGRYTATVTFVDEAEAVLTLTVKPYETDVNGVKKPLYDMTIAPADVELTVVNGTDGTEHVSNLTSLTAELTLKTGFYIVKVKYKDNIYTYPVTVEKTGTALTVYASPAYLGGSITIPNSKGVRTTYYSYKDVAVGATRGGNWELVDSQRDTVKIISHTFAYQNGVSGTKYYLEGVFDTTVTAKNDLGGFSGLLASHGPETLNDSDSDTKFLVGFVGGRLAFSDIPKGWAVSGTGTLFDLKNLGFDYDPTAVRLGVVRDGCDYYFFIDGHYVARHYYTGVTTESGFGICGSPTSMVIKKFNYSTLDGTIDALKACAPAADKSIDLYFIAGQSNASGYSRFDFAAAGAIDDRLQYGFDNIYYAGDAESTDFTNRVTVHRDLRWQLARMGQGAGNDLFGAEAGMALELSEYYNAQSGKQAGIVKFAHGGTALLDEIGGENAVAGNWVPPSYQATITPKNAELTGGLYRKFIAQVEKNVAELKKMGYTTFNVKGLYWMQGETDKGNPTEYKKAFAFLASDLRRDLGEMFDKDLSALPVFIGEISRTSGDASTGTVAMNNAFIEMQRTLPTAVANCFVTPSGKYDINKWENGGNVAVGTDSWHWNMSDMLAIGREVGDSILKNVLAR